jgi:hypothetical protein
MFKSLIVLLAANISFASMDSIDSECRIQAKESAITTYQSCVKESRTQKIDEIRKEYQSKLNELKSYYDGELKKMSLTSKASDEKPVQLQSPMPEVNLKKKSKGSKSSGLPAKKTIGKSLPVRNIEPEVRSEVSTTPSYESSDSEIVTVDDGSI